jgi:Tfp pilus assembly PilM family ATPase
MQGGVPYFTKDLQVGGHTFVEAAQRKFNLSQAEAAAAVRGESGAALEIAPVIEQACEGLATALERAQAYLRTAGEAGAVTRIMLCGGSSLTPAVAEFLNRDLACRPKSPIRSCGWPTTRRCSPDRT